MIKKDLRILTIVIKNVPHMDRGPYGHTVELTDYAQCEKIAMKEIIKNNFDLTDTAVHLLRSVLKLTLKEFGEAFNLSDVAVLKWEKGNKIPHAQKVLMKSFARDKLGLAPLNYSELIEFKNTVQVEVDFYSDSPQEVKKAS